MMMMKEAVTERTGRCRLKSEPKDDEDRAEDEIRSLCFKSKQKLIVEF